MTALERLIAAHDATMRDLRKYHPTIGDDAPLITAARQEQAELVAACDEALPWVATAMAHRRDKRPEFDAHPDAVKNHAAALALLQATLAKHQPSIA